LRTPMTRREAQRHRHQGLQGSTKVTIELVCVASTEGGALFGYP
jgi:hypothetical protein